MNHEEIWIRKGRCRVEDADKSVMKVTTETMEDLAAVFKIFGDFTRLTILSLLMDHEELCVGDIAERLNMTQSGVSHQLALLKQSKLVKTKRDGKSIYYSIADEHVSAIIRIGMEHVLEE